MKLEVKADSKIGYYHNLNDYIFIELINFSMFDIEKGD